MVNSIAVSGSPGLCEAGQQCSFVALFKANSAELYFPHKLSVMCSQLPSCSWFCCLKIDHCRLGVLWWYYGALLCIDLPWPWKFMYIYFTGYCIQCYLLLLYMHCKCCRCFCLPVAVCFNFTVHYFVSTNFQYVCCHLYRNVLDVFLNHRTHVSVQQTLNQLNAPRSRYSFERGSIHFVSPHFAD